jgi:TRAP-type C4-dicarboxylate transport system permease large subunit
MVNIGTSMFFAEISGSAVAELLTIPERWREIHGHEHAHQHEESAL